ncbi:MAG: efflux RND transporter permease subunit [Myxococcota bacterium]
MIEEYDGPESPFFRAWARYVLRHRVQVAAIVALLTAAAVWVTIDRIAIDMNIETFMDRDSRALEVLEDYRDQFGRDDVFVVLVEGDVFSMPYLERLRGLHEELADLDMDLESLGERRSDREQKRSSVWGDDEPPPPELRAEEPPETRAPDEDDAFGSFEEAGGGGDDAFGDFGEAGGSGDDAFGSFEDPTSTGDDWEGVEGGTIVDEIVSLVNARRTRGREVTQADGGGGLELRVGELLDPWPDEGDLEAVREDVLSDPALVGRVVDEEGRFSAVLVRTQFMDEGDSARVFDRIKAIAAKRRAEGFEPRVSGLPALGASLNHMIQREIQRLFVYALAALLLVMVYLFRHPLGVLGPGVVVLLAGSWTFAMMAAVGMPVTMLSNMLPAFVIAVGVGDSVHVQSVYRDRRRLGVSNEEAIVQAVATTGKPILFTTLTTMFGLLSFHFATLDAVGEMGTAGAFGVACALLHTLVVLPIVLSLNKRSLLGAREHGHPDRIDRFLDACAAISGRGIYAPPDEPVHHGRRRATLLGAALLAAAAVYGASLLDVWHNPLSWVPEDDPTKVAFEMTDRNLSGAASVQLLIRAGGERGMRDLELLRGLEDLEQHVRDYEDPAVEDVVGTSVSLLDVVKETNQALHGGDPDHYRLPDTQRELSDVLFLFENAGPDEMRRLASADLRTSQMTFRVRWLEATSYGPLTRYVEQGIEEHVGDLADIEPTGAAYTLFTTVSALISNLIRSFSVAFLVITAFMMVLLRDVRLGLVAMVPNLLPIVLIMGIMGYAGVPIDMSNLLVASVAIGLAVDDTIHFLHRWKVHYDHQGDVEEAIADSLRHAGRAMVGTTLILGVGFFTYMAAELTSIQRFGYLTGLATLMALLVDITFGPALIRTFYRSKRAPASERTDARTAEQPATEPAGG